MTKYRANTLYVVLYDAIHSLGEQFMAIEEHRKDTLGHPMILPLINLLEKELYVVNAACKAADLQSTRSTLKTGLVLSLLEFRNVMTKWEEGRQGQVRFTILASYSRNRVRCMIFFFTIEIHSVLGSCCSRYTDRSRYLQGFNGEP